MRKFLVCMIAAVLATGLSAFKYVEEIKRASIPEEESKKQAVMYAIFQETSPSGEMDFTNYVLQTTLPPSAFCPGAVKVCWIRIIDRDGDGTITQIDFLIIANELDVDNDNLISDDQNENNVTYAEKA